jgi:S-adenosylmethionine-dependent methyltransferase
VVLEGILSILLKLGDVTLADLSHKNIDFGLNKAKELGVPLSGIQVDSRDLSTIEDEQYDHVLCM